MLQPFFKLEPSFAESFLEKMLSLKKIYFVSQGYKRGFNHLAEIHKEDILLTDYADEGLAKIHLNAVKADKYAAIINLTKPVHFKKIREMITGEVYDVYRSAVPNLKELEKRLDNGYKIKLRRYIETQTNWRIPQGESVQSQFEVRFGELFLNLKWRTQRVRLKFEDIERM